MKLAFDTWSQKDLQTYLEDFGIKAKPTSTREELIQNAKENTQWFFGFDQEPYYKRYYHNAAHWMKQRLNSILPKFW